MKTFVRIQEGFPRPGLTGVVEVINTDRDIDTLYHPAFVAQLVEVTGVDPMPGEWWLYEDGAFLPSETAA